MTDEITVSLSRHEFELLLGALHSDMTADQLRADKAEKSEQGALRRAIVLSLAGLALSSCALPIAVGSRGSCMTDIFHTSRFCGGNGSIFDGPALDISIALAPAI